MPVKQITNSSKVNALGFKAHFNLSTGKLLVDLSPTVWKTGGAASVIGAALIVISPSGRIMSNGASNNYVPPMSNTVQLDLPLFNDVYEWGVYQFRVTLDEGGGSMQVIEGTFDLCAPFSNDAKNGKLCIEAQPDCDDGVLRLYAGSTKYKGLIAQAWNDDYNFYYPQAAGMNPVPVIRFPIELDLVSGTSVIKGSSIALFDAGNNFLVTAVYDADEEIYAYCEFPCHLWCAYEDLVNAVASCEYGSEDHAAKYDRLRNVEHYMTLIMFGHKCGKNVSRFIKFLEDLLGIKSACPPVVIGTTLPTTTTTTTQGTTTTTTTLATTTTTTGTTTTTTAGTTTTTTTSLTCPTVTDIIANLGGTSPISNLYFGSNTDGSMPDAAAIQAGNSSAQDPNGTINVDWTSVGAPAFLWFAIPAPITKTSWFASVFSNGAIGTPDDLFGAPTVVNVGGQNFNVYVTNYQTQFTQICQIS